MKQLIFKLFIPVLALVAVSQQARAQWTANASAVYLDAANAVKNVGIGTSAPSQKLQLVGGNILLDQAPGTTTGNLYFGGVPAGTGAANGMRLSYSSNTNGYLDVRSGTAASANGLIFRVYPGTAYTEQMRICTNGRVGIGTAAPTTRLNVSSGSSNDGIRVNQTGNTAATLSLQASSGKNWALFSTGAGNTEGPGHLTFYDWTANAERMRISSSGNVGIGIQDPLQHKLHVAGGVMISGPNPAGGPMLLFSDNVASNAYPNGRWGIEYEPNHHGLNFWRPWNPNSGGENYLLFLKDDGKIGMGVDPANCSGGLPSFPNGYRLYVKGGVLTDRVKIASHCSVNWADYVFAEDYKLKPLQEVEAFIKENKHLPNVPSAQQVEEEGLDVADMLARQMEKIEELMLHTIELNKRVEKLEAENKALQQQAASTDKQ